MVPFSEQWIFYVLSSLQILNYLSTAWFGFTMKQVFWQSNETISSSFPKLPYCYVTICVQLDVLPGIKFEL